MLYKQEDEIQLDQLRNAPFAASRDLHNYPELSIGLLLCNVTSKLAYLRQVFCN